MVVGGDWNEAMPWDKGAGRLSKEAEAVMQFAEALKLEEPLGGRLALGDERPSTWRGGQASTWIDYYLVSKRMRVRGLVVATGVVGDRINNSDHASIVLDVDLGAMLGKSDLWRDIEEVVKRRARCDRQAQFKAVQLKRKQRVRDFQEEVLKLWPVAGGLERRIRAFSEKVTTLGSAVWRAGEARTRVQREGDALMREVEGVLVRAQLQVRRKLPQAGRRHHHMSTPESVRIRKDWVGMGRLAVAIREWPVGGGNELARRATSLRGAGVVGRTFLHACRPYRPTVITRPLVAV